MDPAIVDKNPVNEGEMLSVTPPVKKVNLKERPQEGLSTWIGKPAKRLEEKHGKPARTEPSAYGYEWWVYTDGNDQYTQYGIDHETNKVSTVFSLSANELLAPFAVGQSVDELYTQLNMDSVVELKLDGTDYRFELSEEDLHVRPLIKFKDIYAQVYLDKFEGTVSSVRFMDAKTLVRQRPYEITFRGKLHEAKELTDIEWKLVERGNEQQIVDLTNMIRKRFGVQPVNVDEKTAIVALSHSEDMMNKQYFSHVSPDKKDLSDRLEEGQVPFQMAGENIAAQYTDAIAAVEGWLNSKGHRDTMLNKEFTDLGVGVYKKYYTQNFIKKKDD